MSSDTLWVFSILNLIRLAWGHRITRLVTGTAHHLMAIAAINNSAVASGQTRDEIKTALNIADNNKWQDYISNSPTLSNTPDSVWVQLGDLLKTQYNSPK